MRGSSPRPDEDDCRAIEPGEPGLVGLRAELVDVDRDAQDADLFGREPAAAASVCRDAGLVA